MPKESLRIGGETFLDRVVAAASGAFDEVVAVSRDHQHPGLRAVREEPHDEASPLFGIEAAGRDVQARGEQKFWILAVDYPAITAAALRDYRERFQSVDAELLVPLAEGETHMLCAGYSTMLLPRIALRLRQRKFVLRDLLAESRTLYFNTEGAVLRNINTPADYELLEQEHEQTDASR